jgi:hypothetical protein
VPGRPVRRRGGAGAVLLELRAGSRGRGASRGSRLSTLEVPPPAPAPLREAAEPTSATPTPAFDAGRASMQETRPRPPPPRARRPRPRGRAAAGPADAEMPSAGRDCRVGSGMDQAKGFIHRENTAHGDPCDSPETLPLAHAHW